MYNFFGQSHEFLDKLETLGKVPEGFKFIITNTKSYNEITQVDEPVFSVAWNKKSSEIVEYVEKLKNAFPTWTWE